MPIYTFKCSACGKEQEVLSSSMIGPMCNHKDEKGSGILLVETRMELVPSVPAPPQWGCQKGF